VNNFDLQVLGLIDF